MSVPGTIRTLENPSASLSVDLNGGAICDFHRKEAPSLNPLSFAFTKADMPPNNRDGVPYKGHFLCLGRWGAPSKGEQQAGLPHHGQAANLPWKELPGGGERTLPGGDQASDAGDRVRGSGNRVPGAESRTLSMEVDCPLEGLRVDRQLRLDSRNPVFAMEETVRNTAPLGKLYNVVQHPTLAAPFLDDPVVISCNATTGFDQLTDEGPAGPVFQWPAGRSTEPGLGEVDLSRPSRPWTSVFSFIADPQSHWGWVTAWSARHRLLLGYVWKRADYPWIHLWHHWNGSRLQYLGIEFGTPARHLPLPGLLENGLELFGEQTTAYIDAGANQRRRYLSFLCETPEAPESGTGLELTGGGAGITLRRGKNKTTIETDFSDFL